MADAGNMSYVAGDSADSSDEEASETIVGVTWQWVDFDDAGGNCNGSQSGSVHHDAQ